MGTRSLELGKLRRSLTDNNNQTDGPDDSVGLFDDIQDDGDSNDENRTPGDDFDGPSNSTTKRSSPQDDFGGELE